MEEAPSNGTHEYLNVMQVGFLFSFDRRSPNMRKQKFALRCPGDGHGKRLGFAFISVRALCIVCVAATASFDSRNLSIVSLAADDSRRKLSYMCDGTAASTL